MAKRWRKKKAGYQKSKGPRKKRQGDGLTSSATGAMGGMRRTLQKVRRSVAGGEQSGKQRSMLARIFDLALWVAVGVMLIFAIKRCQT